MYFRNKVPDNTVQNAGGLWEVGQPPSKEKPTQAELDLGLREETKRNETNLRQYHEVVEALVTLVEGGTL